MSSLAVYPHTSPELPNKVLNHADDIASTLSAVDIDYRQVELPAALRPGCEQAEFDAAYGLWLQAFMGKEGHVQQELFNLQRNHPQKLELRARYLDEQVQSSASTGCSWVVSPSSACIWMATCMCCRGSVATC